jgi:hypothetical protein
MIIIFILTTTVNSITIIIITNTVIIITIIIIIIIIITITIIIIIIIIIIIRGPSSLESRVGPIFRISSRQNVTVEGDRRSSVWLANPTPTIASVGSSAHLG